MVVDGGWCSVTFGRTFLVHLLTIRLCLFALLLLLLYSFNAIGHCMLICFDTADTSADTSADAADTLAAILPGRWRWKGTTRNS